MFFSFQLALPKTSVLLLCQHNSRFLTFFILPFAPLPFSLCFWDISPFALWNFALCCLGILLFVLWKFTRFFYSMLFHSLSFCGSTRSFSMSVCFNSDFLTFFILFLPFAPFLCFWDISPFALFNFTNSLLPFTSPFLCEWNSPFALLLTAICCKNLY